MTSSIVKPNIDHLNDIPQMLRDYALWIESGKEPEPRQVVLIALPKKKRGAPYMIYGWGKGVGPRVDGIMGGALAYGNECLWPGAHTQRDNHGEVVLPDGETPLLATDPAPVLATDPPATPPILTAELPAARVTLQIECGNDPSKPRVVVNAPDGVTPAHLYQMLLAAVNYAASLDGTKEYHAVQGSLPL